jgi:hypothetical protein
MKPLVLLLLSLGTALPNLHSADRGVVGGPAGALELRSEPRKEAKPVATVKEGEVFEFEGIEDIDWCRVTLASGKSGFLPAERIRLFFTLEEIPEKDEANSEVGDHAKRQGFDYCATARAAAQGEAAAMLRYFSITDTDGAAGEGHAYYSGIVIHLLGDEKLAAFLESQPIDYRIGVRNHFSGGFVTWGDDEGISYGERHFPRSYALLCREKITDWPSPDGRYAIRKTFSSARVTRDSKVVKAELIEKASGAVVTDLTGDDLAVGSSREGAILWSPDSRRFAYYSGGLATAGRTVVWQQEGTTFVRKELPKIVLPGRAGDAELVGAALQWEHIEPLRWTTPETLKLQLHDYFEKLREDRSIDSIGRTYTVTWNPASGEVEAKQRVFE